jgi:hypothetical protein
MPSSNRWSTCWRNSHLLVGGLGLLIFLLQGQYMGRVLGMETLPDGERMLYRSAHIYLMLACVANISVGYFLTPERTLNHLQRLISVVLLLCPALLVWSFFTESSTATLERPIASYTLYLLFGSGVLLLLQELYSRLVSSRDR